MTAAWWWVVPEQNVVDIGLYLGATLGWVDVSADGRQGVADSGGGITITRREDAPGTMDLVLANPGGRYSPRNPRSDLFGLLGRNTPIRVGLLDLAETFDAAAAGTWASGWSTWGAGGSLTAADFGAGAGSAWHRVPAANAFRGTHYTGRRWRDCEVRATFTLPADVTGGPLEPANVLLRLQDVATYYMARVEVSAAEAVTVSLHHSSGGLIAGPVTVAGVVNAGQQFAVAASCVGDRLAVKVWPAAGGEPRDWQLTAVDTRLTAAGYVGVRSGVAGSNTNTLPVEFRYDNVRVIDRRACMEVSSWPPRWNPAGTDTWVPVQAAGILRRLNQGAKPLDSALYRYLPTTAPTAYWPLEDPAGSLQARSAVPGVEPMVPFEYSRFTAPGTGAPVPAAGLPVFGSGQGIPGSQPVVDLAQGGTLQASLPYAQFNGWRIEWVMRAPRDKSSNTVVPIRWGTDGSWGFEVQLDSSGVRVGMYAGNNWLGGSVGRAFSSGFEVFDGLAHHYRVEAAQSGSLAVIRLYIDAVHIMQFLLNDNSVPVGAPNSITRVILNPLEIRQGDPAAESMPVLGHVAVWNPPGAATDTTTAMRGHAGESAANRIARLCAEQGVPVLVSRGSDASAPMGPQRPATFLDLIEECVDADGGILGEAIEQLALTYRCLSALYNQTPVTVPYDHLAPPLEPTDDDDHVRNDVTASRPDGATARAVLTTGPLSTLPPPTGVGTYDTSVTVNVAADAQLPDQAGWRLHVGTWDEARYPTARVDLAAPVWSGDVDLAAAVTALAGGDVVALDELPAWLPPGPALEMVRGSVERIDEFTRTLDWTLTPAGPYTVAEVGGEPRVAADGSVTIGLADGATTMLLSSTPENGPWTEDPADFPLSLRVGGERVTASSIARSLVDTFGRTVVDGWGGVWGGITSGSTSAASVNGSEGLIAVSGVNVEHHIVTDLVARTQDMRAWIRVPVTPTGGPINAGLLLRYVDVNTYIWVDAQIGTDSSITLRLIKRLSGAVTVLGSVATGVTHSTSVPLAIRAEVSGSLLRARVWPSSGADPGIWQSTAVDGALPNGTRAGVIARLMTGNTNAQPVTIRVDNVSVQQPQLVTLSARGVNGVTRTWPAGTEVDVWQPAIVGL